jgi:hypothetical protein
MAGRIPKPKEQRTRTNKTMGATLARDSSGIAPVLPGIDELSSYARDYWEIIWNSPMGTVYLDADIPALVRLTELVHVWHLLKDNTVLMEIRQLEDRFGLSPLSRRRLEWEISKADPEASVAPSSSAEDERWLKVVN